MKLPEFQGAAKVNGRDNRNRRRSRGRNSERPDRTSGRDGNTGDSKPKGDFHLRKPGDRPNFDKKSSLPERPNWTAPAQSSEPLPALHCIRCGLPINDSHSALSDRKTGEPVHFDCVITELSEQEQLEAGDVLSYIGGGRFGVVHFNNGKNGEKNFTIKKILEWEDKEKRAQWRNSIADHYSVT